MRSPTLCSPTISLLMPYGRKSTIFFTTTIKHAQAMQLEHRFRTTVKGQLSINEYCRLLKNLSEYLDDVDAPVTEHALVLQVLQGLPHDIRSQVQFLQYQNPLPTFLEVRSALLLVEQQQTDAVYGAGAPSTALLSTGGGGGQAGSRHRHDRGSGYGGSGSNGSGGFGNGSGGRGRTSGGGSGGGNRGGGQGCGGGGNQRQPSDPNPWTFPSPSPGLLGPGP
ncbi:unnamed protein product [Cuscuta campestris]|uniref:Uncharacterized protein n=1 Tax=Cuscuta campestris TaxID=132261 RepID=A0A484NII2_9ASTE|nr:unnamed protein product [Cuscuta campestris]